MQKIITHEDVRIMVQTSTGYSELDQDIVLFKLGNPTELRDRYQATTFAAMISQTVTAEGLTVALPDASAAPETLQQAMRAIFNLPGTLIREWLKALDEVNTAPGGDMSLQQETSADPNTSGGGDSSSST